MNPWAPTRAPGVTVFRVMTLEPLTLGHLSLLSELSVDLFGPLGITEAMAVAFVCSQPHTSARKRQRAIWLRPFLSVVGLLCRKCDLPKQVEIVREYLAEQFRGPEFAGHRKQTNELAAPWHVNLRALAMGKLHLSPTEADAMPIQWLRQHLAAFAEANGEAKVITNKTLDFVAQCEAADARARARAAGMTEQHTRN